MANTKIPIELSSTPSIVDNGDATAITIDSSENIFLSNTTSLIGVNTSDGSDNKSVMVNGGGAASSSRGAYVWLKGNEHSSNPGFLQLTSGSVSGAAITMITNGSERARITNDGLTFNGDTATANALDDYEEGSFTPTIGSGTIGAASGRYTKIGRLVSFNLFVGNFSDTTGTGAIQIGIPPFTTQSATQSHVVVMTRYFDLSHRSITGYLTDNGSIMTLYQNGNGANNWEQLSHDNLSSGSAYVRASGVYYTN